MLQQGSQHTFHTIILCFHYFYFLAKSTDIFFHFILLFANLFNHVLKTQQIRTLTISYQCFLLMQFSRHSQPSEVFYKKAIPKISPKLTEKHLWTPVSVCNFKKTCENLLRSATLIKKPLWHKCFPVNFSKHLIFFNTFFTEHLWPNASVWSILHAAPRIGTKKNIRLKRVTH